MIANEKIKPLTVVKEYYQTRNALTESMHLFFLYDENDKESLQFWSDFLLSLIEKFPKHLNISTISNDIEKHKDLMQLFIEGDIKELKYPGIILAHPHLTEPQIAIGVSPIDVYSLVEKFDNFYENEFEKEKKEMFEKIKAILESYPVICFIKGTPQDPFCKFSRKFIELLNSTQIRYKAINIFQDEKIRCYLRLYSNWKTYPQLYINGKIIGGVDVLTELLEKGKFMEMVPKEVTIETLSNSIKEIISKNKIAIACDKENEVLTVLKEKKKEFGFIDIGSDSRIDWLLKKSFGVKSIPALFIDGKYTEGDILSF